MLRPFAKLFLRNAATLRFMKVFCRESFSYTVYTTMILVEAHASDIIHTCMYTDNIEVLHQEVISIADVERITLIVGYKTLCSSNVTTSVITNACNSPRVLLHT